MTLTPSRRTSAAGVSPPAGTARGDAGASTGAARGRRTVKVEPSPGPRLSACTVPPCSSTRWRTMASPRPRPPCARVLVLSACRKRSNTWGRNSGSMPLPSSATLRVRHEGSRRRRTSMRPPCGVNFTAFETRFHTTCCRRSGSPVMVGTSGGTSTPSAIPFASAEGRTASTPASITGTITIGRTSRRSLPVMMRETSSRSPMSWVCARTLRSMTSSPRRIDGWSRVPERSMTVQPRMGVSGVRSSWDRVARNSSLARLAFSAVARASCDARYRRALSTARAARRPSSSARSRSSRPNTRPEWLLSRLRAPSVRSRETIGTTITDRTPRVSSSAR